MALTKAQVSLVTVTALGIAPGGYEAQLSALATQKELAAFIGSNGYLSTGTNAEFALDIGENVGLEAGDSAITALFNALESGTSRADAVVDFANGQLVAGNATLTAALAKAVAYTGGSIDPDVLKAAVAADAVATPSGLVIQFEDEEEDQSSTETETEQTFVNIGKAQLDAGTGQISSDFTFKLANQIGSDDTFEGQFLSPVLDRQAPESTSSSMYIQVLDGFATEEGFGPVERLKLNGVGFHLDGEFIEIIDSPANKDGAIYNATTYEELKVALGIRIQELANGINLPEDADEEVYAAALANFSVELGSTFTNSNRNGDLVEGTTIVITDLNGGEFNLNDGFAGYSDFGGLHPFGNLNDLRALNSEESSEILQLITTNLELDNIGYGSQGGSIDLGGQSNSDKGIEEFKVTAKNGVWLTTLVSQGAGDNDHLERIELQTGSNGYFRVGTQANSPTHLADWTSTDGLQDVQQVEASAAGSVAINANISDDILSRYEMDDTGAYTADDGQGVISYNLTSGNDVLRLGVAGEVLEQVDTTVNVTTGEGNDQLIFITTGTDNWVTNQQLLNNVTLNAGDGDDWVIAQGAGKANILAGNGDDVIRADNSGLERAIFVFNTNNTDLDDLLSNSDDTLSNNQFGGAQSHRFFNASVVVTFKGFESAAIEIDSTDYMTSNKQINQAIKKAVNTDPVLSKLLWAVDNEGNALGIESLIDGVMLEGDLEITITPAVEDDISAQTLEDAAEAYGVDPDDFEYDDLDNATTANAQYATDFVTDGVDVEGTDSTVESDNLITAGRGDDVITLGTGDESNDTLIYTGYNNGNDSIVNFVAGTESSSNTTEAIFADAAHFAVGNIVDGSAGVAAGADTAEVFTLKFGEPATDDNIVLLSAANAGPNDVLNLSANVTAAVLTTDTPEQVAQKVVDALDASGATLDFTYAVDGNGGVVFTEATPAGADIDESTMVAAISDDAGAVATVEASTDGAAGTGAVVASRETFDVTISGPAIATGEITFNGETIPVLAGDSAADIAASIGAGTYTDWSVTGVVGGVVSFQSNTDINATDVERTDFGGLTTTTTTTTLRDGHDLLDFTSYLTSADEFGATLATDLVTSNNYTAGNQVKVVNFADDIELDDEAVSFADLDASTLKSILNGDEDADNVFGNLDIDAHDIAAAGLDQDYILMVQNHDNDGEYKVFHLTAEADNDGGFASVNLVGVLDFGDGLNFVDQNFVGSAEIA